MISRRALDESALAISSSCRSATPSPRTGVSGSEVDAELVQHRRRLGAHRAASRPCRSGRAAAGRRRRSRRPSGRERRVGSWYMATMPSRCAVCGSPIRVAAAVEQRARPRPAWTTPVEDLHERRLAGAVLADERVHRRRLDREADVATRLDAAVALRDAAQLDERRPGGSSRVRGGDAAVDVDDVAGRLRRSGPGEERDRLGDVLGVDVDAELGAPSVEGLRGRPRLTP